MRISSKILSAYLELCKPRILTLVLVTTALGYFLGGKGIHSVAHFLWTLIGSGLVCAGASALNHYLERDVDSLMKRTRNRPLPMGILAPSAALSFGISLVLSGVMLLFWKVNLLTAFLGLLTAFLYVVVYTPMKRLSWLNTTFGAIPGALPPVGGWTAATGELNMGAWVLFLILFVWQHPHFYAIAWMFKEDYRQAGFKMLPVIDATNTKTFTHILIFSAVLIPISIAPTLVGLSGIYYMIGAFILSTGLLMTSIVFYRTKSYQDARRLLKSTVLYLPLLLALIILDTIILSIS